MSTTSGTPSAKNSASITSGIIMRFVQVAIVFAVQAVILFLAAGRLNWTWAWVFLGVCLLSVIVNGSILLRKSPETVAERGRPKETKSWDKVISGFYALALYLALPLVAGLDERFAWTGTMGDTWHLAGAVVLFLGLGLGGWAMISNAYFSTAVRIQTDRGQTVCRTGPYRFIRHPGYVGFILQALATALLLGSAWSLIPAVTSAILLVLRTFLEDRTLQAELPGYQEYMREIRYRLVPGIW